MRSLPYTLMGLLFGFSSLARPRLFKGVVLFRSRHGFAWLFLVRRRFAAATFGRVVICAEHELPESLFVHEQHHVHQYGQLGLLFLPVYLYWHVRAGYSRNPLELSAVSCADESQADKPGIGQDGPPG